MQDLTGRQLGNYRLKKPLGKGGFATVYLAEHTMLQNEAAIKVLNETDLSTEDQEGFIQEARLISKLHHPHIVRLLEFGIEVNQRGVDGSIPYLVMEYAPNGSLRHRHGHRAVVPFQNIVSYVNQIAHALQYAHDQKDRVVHLDVKPENMLAAGNNDILLSDFGIAVTGHDSKGPPLVKNGVVQGTVAYMAPERFQNPPHPRRASDQYSLGIVVYEWLVGTRPFVGTVPQIIEQHLRTPPPPLYGAHSHITKPIEDVVMKALAKVPEQRYPSVKEFAQNLDIAIRSASHYGSQSAYQQAGGQPGNQGPQPQGNVRQAQQGSTSQPDYPGQQQPQENMRPAQQDSSGQQGYPGQRQPPPANVRPAQQESTSQQGQRQQQEHVRPQQQQGNVGPQQEYDWRQQQQDRDTSGTVEAAPWGPTQRREQWSLPGNQGRQDPPATPWQGRQEPVRLGGSQWGVPPNDSTVGTNPGQRQVPPVSAAGGFQGQAILQRGLLQTLNSWFELDSEFARLPKHRLFREVVIILNILSAIILGLIQQPISPLPIIGGVLFSVVLFILCIRIVNMNISMVFGMLVALYWGYVGAVIGDRLSAFSLFSAFPLPELLALAFLAVSALLLMRYVLDRLP